MKALTDITKSARSAFAVPDGGAAGDVLAKASATNNDTAWVAPKVTNKITVGTTAPVAPAVNDIWVDTN